MTDKEFQLGRELSDIKAALAKLTEENRLLKKRQKDPVEYEKLVKINKLLRELLRENETDLKNIESAQGVWRTSKDGGGYCP